MEIEYIDYTAHSGEDSHWVCCSSDYDNYAWCGDLATTTYGPDYNDVLEILPGGMDWTGCTTVTLEYEKWLVSEGSPWDYYVVEYCDDASTDSPAWTVIYSDGGVYGSWWHVGPITVPGPYTTDMGLRFRFVSDSTVNYRGLAIDDVTIMCDSSVFFLEDFGEDCGECDLDNFGIYTMNYGNYWHWCTTEDAWCCHDHPSMLYPANIDNAMIWSTEVIDTYAAWLTFSHDYDLDTTCPDYAKLEISDNGGATWAYIDLFDGSSGGYVTETYDLTPYCGKNILIRFRLHACASGGGMPGWCVKDLAIYGKIDYCPPTSTAAVSGTLKDTGWYNTGVSITITATDMAAGIREIHYILDGVETVVPGDTATVTVNSNGDHTLTYWAVDNVGNVEEQQHTLTFKIDKGNPPTVAITAPEPGLYLFGNKLLSASKVIIIGSFNIEATASDADSGVYAVEFFLDGESIASDISAPFEAYCSVKHMGAGTIKVVAEDFAQNTAEDTLDITYYKFL